MLSALFSAVIFHQNWLGLLAWVALVPLFIALPRLQGKLLFWLTVAFGFTWYYLGCWWLHTLVVFHWLIPLGVAAGALYYGLYFLMFAFPAAWCARRLPVALRPWGITGCWVAVEYLRNFTDMAFPWNLMGHSQFPFNRLFMSYAAVGGVSVISFLIVLVNAVIATIATAPRQRSSWISAAAPAVLLAASPLLFSPHHPAGSSHKYRVSVIQPGISQVIRWDAQMGRPDDTTESYTARYQQADVMMQERADMLIRQAGNDRPSLIVLPESPFLGGYFVYQQALQNGLWNLAQATSATLFFGADNTMLSTDYAQMAARGQHFLSPKDKPRRTTILQPDTFVDDTGTTRVRLDNMPPTVGLVAAWQVSPTHGLEPYVYNKMQLVPFGETIPFLGGVHWLQTLLESGGIAGNFKPGLENTIFEADGNRYGAVICFESTFAYLTRNLARGGAQFICVLTNDSWYDPSYAREQGGFWGTLFKIPGLAQMASAGPNQHFIQSQLRAIETGLPVVRSANNGISALIDGEGNVQDSLPYGESGYLSGEITLEDQPTETFFTRHGDGVAHICLVAWAAAFLGLAATNLRRWRVK